MLTYTLIIIQILEFGFDKENMSEICKILCDFKSLSV